MSKDVEFAKLQPPSIALLRPNSKVHANRNLCRNRFRGKTIGALIITAWLLTACNGPLFAPTPPPETPHTSSLPATVAGAPADALAALIEIERQASIDGDLATLEQLWSPDGRIVDGRNTVAPDDDYIWAGREAIMDRYVMAVFPNPPPPLSGPDALAGLAIQTESDVTATAVNGGDRWQLVSVDGRWWLQELVYQQP